MHLRETHIGTLFIVLYLGCGFIPVKAQTPEHTFFEQKVLKIYYASDADQLTDESRKAIRAAIIEIGSHRIREIYLEGHTDSDASDDYNLDLSKRRSSNTRSYLLSQGVKPKMIREEAFGEARPMSDIKRLNRRVEITFVYEVTIAPEDLKKRKYIEGFTFDANTRKNMGSNFVIEMNGSNQLKKTNARGYFRIVGSGENDLALIFSREGYLNKEVILDRTALAQGPDTVRLEVYLTPVKVLDRITFQNIYFYTDSDKFKPESQADLESLLSMMQANPDLYIEIQGHMNFPANRKATKMQQIYNYNLSHSRAKAVFTYLVNNHIERERLTYKGMSNFRMLYPIPKTAEEEDMNKRVEVWTLSVSDIASN